MAIRPAIFPLRGMGVLPSFPSARRANLSGAVAQLGERYNGIVEVVGSIPSGSTKISMA